jgi:quercetin dioxygenase-like cupin family protein
MAATIFLSDNIVWSMIMRLMLVLFWVVLAGADHLAAQNVEVRGITSEIKLEEVVFGHLPDINGKFKLRATEVTFAPGAYLGVHHHIGPGIRYVLSGEVAFSEGGQTTVYKTGDLPSMLIAIPFLISTPVNAAPVNWLP